MSKIQKTMILDGRKTAEKIRGALAEKIRKHGKKPKLRVILVGEDAASLAYVTRKEKACAEVGIEYECLRFPKEVQEEDILRAIAETNDDRNVHGLIVQLPLPPHIDKRNVVAAINEMKDVDGFTQ